MSAKVPYKSETIDLLNELSSKISSSLILTKDNDRLKVNRTNPAETISFFFSSPVDDFNFNDEELAFYNFPEFYQLFSVFTDPIIKQNNDLLIISKDKAKIKYKISDPEVIAEGPKGFNIKADLSCKFKLTVEDLRNLRKMIGLVSAEKATIIRNSDSELSIILGNETHENSYEKTFEVESNDEFDFDIPSELFSVIPDGNYSIELYSEGIVVLNLITENEVSLQILTTELERDN